MNRRNLLLLFTNNATTFLVMDKLEDKKLPEPYNHCFKMSPHLRKQDNYLLHYKQLSIVHLKKLSKIMFEKYFESK